MADSRIDAALDDLRRRLPLRPGAGDLATLRARGALIVDIRPVEQRRRDGELSGAVVIDRNVLEWRLDPTSPDRIPEATDADREMVIVCNEGYASSLAAASLQGLGLHRATDLAGGIQAVIAGDPDDGGVSDTPSSSVPPVACTLDAAQLPERLQEWRDVLAHAVGRVDIDGGIRLQLDASTPLDRLALLVRAEQACCAFFAFAITVDDRGVGLEVRAPVEALSIVDSLFGQPA